MSGSAMDGKVTEINLPTFKAKVQYWRTHHPIVVGLGIIAVIQTCIHGPYILKSMFGPTARTDVIHKYKHRYIVYRPDDPHVKFLKTGPIGLDHYGKYVS